MNNNSAQLSLPLASVKLEAIERATKLLVAAGAEFHIKCSGMEFGEPISKEKPPKAQRHVVNKGIAGFVKHHLGDMAIGDVRVLASEQYSLDHLQSCCASYCGTAWGKGSFITQREKESHSITVLRVE
jgi:hypothetical protein